MAITMYELERRVTGVEQSFQRIQEQLDRSERLFENFRGHANSCFESLFQRLDQHDRSFEEIFQRLNGHDQNFVSIDQHFERIDRRFEHVDQRFERVDQRLDKIETQMITHADLAAMESRLKDFILATFQKSL